MKDEERGYFPDNEPIWLFTDNMQVKQEIEDGLNRKVMLIRTPDEFVARLGDVRVGNRANTSIIITDSLPTDIQANFSAIVSAIKVLVGVKIVEVGIDPVFANAKAFGTLPGMIRFAQESRRAEQIQELDPNDAKTQLLQGLQNDLHATRVNLNNQLKEVKKLTKEKADLFKGLKDLKGELDTQILPELAHYKDLCEVQEQKLLRLEQDLKIEIEKCKQYLKDKDKLFGENTDLNYKIKAYEGYLESKDLEIKKIKNQKNLVEEDLKKVEQEKLDMLNTLVDEEIHEGIVKELSAERTKVRDLTTKLEQANIQLASKDIKASEMVREINELRKGSTVLSSVGVTTILDSYEMQRTNLVYIKVINELPYHRLAIQYLFDMLAERIKDLSHLAIIRTDEGLDNNYYERVPIVGKVEDVEPIHRVFRLFPNRAMFTGADRFLRNVGLLVVVDYMRNTNYCLNSLAKETYMTMVQRSSDIQKYGLKGAPISLDDDSVFDIQWDSRIANAAVKENRHDLLKLKVQDWIEKLGL